MKNFVIMECEEILRGLFCLSSRNEDLVVDSGNYDSILGHYMLGLVDNHLQDMLVDSMLDGVPFPIKVFTIEKETDLKHLMQYKKDSIFDDKFVLRIDISRRLNQNIISFLMDISVNKKLMYLKFKDQSDLNRFHSQSAIQYRSMLHLHKLPQSETYVDKKELITKLLEKWKIAFKDKQSKDLLVSLMIRNPEQLENVKLSLRIFRENKNSVDLDFIDSLFENIDHYNLDDFIVTILRGTKPRKKMEILNYFIKKKEYAPAWLINQIRERLLIINKMYIAYAQGIIEHPIPSHTLERRLKHVGWESGTDLTFLKDRLQQDYLDFVKEVPYKYTVALNQLVFSKQYNNASKIDLYLLIKEVSGLLEHHNQPKGWASLRKNEEMLRNRRGK